MAKIMACLMREEGHVGALHHGIRAAFLARSLVPALETDEGDGRVLAAAEEGEAGDADDMLDFLLLEVVLLDAVLSTSSVRSRVAPGGSWTMLRK